MANEITENERARNAALAFAIDNSRGRSRPATAIVEEAEKYHAFLAKQA